MPEQVIIRTQQELIAAIARAFPIPDEMDDAAKATANRKRTELATQISTAIVGYVQNQITTLRTELTNAITRNHSESQANFETVDGQIAELQAQIADLQSRI